MSVYDKIDAQCEGKEYTTAWGVGQQLKDILRGDPSLEDIVDKDLDVAEMSLEKCEKKIKARADELHKAHNLKQVCIPPQEAEKIIREFYGLPLAGAAPAPAPAPAPVTVEEDTLDFGDFL